MVWENVLTLVQITIAYGLLFVYLPSVCLRDVVGDKPLTYRFIFYQVCANMYLVAWGFVLAFLHCFNPLTLWLTLVALPLAVTALRHRKAVAERFLAARETSQTIMTGMYGGRALRHRIVLSVKQRVRQSYRRYIKGHVPELLGMCAICAVVLVLYGQYHLTHEGFGYGDESVHFNWEQELLHGNPFPSGLYPHALHFLVAAISGMFGLMLIRVSLTFACFYVCLLFCTLYLVLKETFSSKTAVLFGVVFFLATNIFQYYAYWRYQAVLPLELGLIPYCAIFYALPRYVSSRDKRDLFLFALSVAWCIHAHFYTAIAAIFSCLAFGIVFLIPMMKKKVLMRVIAGGLLGGILGVVPFIVGYALGYPFEQSMNWAMGVIEESAEDAESAQEAEQPSDRIVSIETFLDEAFWTINESTSRVLLLGLCAGMMLRVILGILLSKKSQFRHLMTLFWGLNWLIGLCLSTGVITLIQRERFSVFFSFQTVPLFVLPVQMLFDAATFFRMKPRYAEMGLAAASLIFFFFMVKDGYVKDDFTVESNIVAEGDIKTCYRLMKEYPENSWTIMSTTYDLAIVRYEGYHYEIIDLLKQIDIENGTLNLPLTEHHLNVPTKDFFVVVETWIDQYENMVMRHSSREAELYVNRGAPTPELALTNLPPDTELLNNSKIYAYPWRSVVMSKLYYWMEKVKETYPNEVSVFYQDETVTIYHIHQDEYFPLDLMLDYQADLR